jgi:hypothetical protein
MAASHSFAMAASYAPEEEEIYLLGIFKSKLEAEWKRETVCGCGYIDVQKLTSWMERHEPGWGIPNVGRLLHESRTFPRRSRVIIPIHATSQVILDPGDRCLLVFSILLELGKSYLIDTFLYVRITDNALEHLYPQHPTYNELLGELSRLKVEDADTIVRDFEKAKWSYCPAMIKLYKSAGFQGGKVLPFVKKEPITEKGVLTIHLKS